MAAILDLFIFPSSQHRVFIPTVLKILPHDPKEGFKIVLYFFQAVDAEAVRAVLFKYVYDRCPVVAAVGPVEQVPDYNVIRNGMYWIRV